MRMPIRRALLGLLLAAVAVISYAQTPRKVVLATSAARTATFNSEELSVAERGIHLVLNVTASSGTTPTLDVKLQRKDQESGQWVDLPSASFAQKTGTGTDDLVVYPGIAETANRSVSDHIGGVIRAVFTIGGTTPSFTFSLAGFLLP